MTNRTKQTNNVGMSPIHSRDRKTGLITSFSKDPDQRCLKTICPSCPHIRTRLYLGLTCQVKWGAAGHWWAGTSKVGSIAKVSDWDSISHVIVTPRKTFGNNVASRGFSWARHHIICFDGDVEGFFFPRLRAKRLSSNRLFLGNVSVKIPSTDSRAPAPWLLTPTVRLHDIPSSKGC